MAYRTTSWKNTDIGWVPSDWEVKDLRCINNVSMCKRVMKYQTKSVGVIPFYKISTFGGIPDSFIDRDLYEYLRSNFSYPNRGDILFSAAGTIGKYIVFDGNPAYFQDSNIVWIHNDERLVLNSYLYHLYHVIQWCTSEGGIVSRLYNKDIVNLKISIPSLLEQQKIAEVLTDLDDLIAELEKLRDKKQAIKIGAMQELLTGKRRLPGFNKPWKEVELGEMFFNHKIFIGKGQALTSKQLKAGSIPVIAGGKTVPYTNSEYNYDKPCVTISASGAYAGYVWYHKDKIWASDCNVVYGINGYNTEFLSYILKFNQKKLYANQIGGAQPHVYASDIKILTVPDISETEQTAITNILSDMDDEISAINDKINKYKQIKAGVADELLSGRIRLIKPQE